jgi:high-affinity Fe2+/Pb2+ permease
MKSEKLLKKKENVLLRLQRSSKAILSLEIHLLSNRWFGLMFIVVFGWYVSMEEIFILACCLHILTMLYLICMPYMQRRGPFAADVIASS